MRGRSLNGNSQKDLDEDQTLFDVRFWRAYRLLYFVADRILDDSERAEMAVEHCWHSASVRPPHFEYEGAFRSWLVRVLIDEALLLLREKQQTAETKISLDAVLTRRHTP
jgi:DNA-directed RNA polymerase specialized sigma24 family protein